ncbi:hypothetical protein M595_1714 [Lyngbya aestuarii BL J]|uniref:Uncharacterized protein n=1 Tax=Lyngbya aestuarii BL J TaxID=1348334 RepID=U7QPJ1_9CYAN|nr:hypothetical protein M595_1714 [Lyngbya aestuarii BL J]
MACDTLNTFTGQIHTQKQLLGSLLLKNRFPSLVQSCES